ncbi:integral membrane PTH11 [Fusarium albosuccineum]|uniref:Integral membrane PTH11 n=1 Tax=Fusarium albosuccineum TaxID=1237068 RepID=A0A8H4P7J0_9HYPO|nr:integral membrane PTH11 [Fusarium albosuccineum]
MPSNAEAAAQAAAAIAAFRMATIESWTLYSIGVTFALLRLYARTRVAGFRGLQAEDYLMILAICFYTIQTSLAYSIGNAAHGFANNSMTPAERAALSIHNPEYTFRVIGSKIQVAGWTTYSALMWSLKMSMLFFYIRLTDGLGRRYTIQIYIGFGLVISSFVATLIAIYAGCQPLQKYWQINPDPGNACQAAISLPIVWASFAANVSTDIYLIAIPLPMLWGSKLKLIKKIASTIILGAGIFILGCAIMKTVFVLVDPIHGAELAGAWGTRESFVAFMTTNLPLLFPLFRIWFSPILGSVMQSTKNSYQTPSGFRTIGGGGGGRSGQSSKRGGPPTANPLSANLSFNDSEERIVKGETEMKDFHIQESSSVGSDGIVVSNVEIIDGDRKNHYGPGGRDRW